MKRVIALMLILVAGLAAFTGCDETGGTIGPPLPSISLRSLAELNQMREMISCTDEADLDEYLISVEGGGAYSREDLISFINTVDFLPLPALFEGDVIWISRQNNAGNPEDEFVFITIQSTNGDWVRVKYQTSVEDADAEIERQRKNGYFKKAEIDTPIHSSDGRITVYSEAKSAHPSGVGDTVTWTIVVDGILATVVYYSEQIGEINAKGVFCNAAITTLSTLSADYDEGRETQTVLKMLQYSWDGWGISVKSLKASAAVNNVVDALKELKETGEIAPKISDDELEPGPSNYPVKRGTMWIENDGKIYRLGPSMSDICLVETHFGKGKVLEITDELRTAASRAWSYAPRDYHKGVYNKGDKTVELTNVFDSTSSVELRIKSICIEAEYNPQNSITIELISMIDQQITIDLDCQCSVDYLAEGDNKTVWLSKDIPTTVELTFDGWETSRYWVYIRADNTVVEIEVNP